MFFSSRFQAMCCLAWPAHRWNNIAFIQIPPSQLVCRPQGGFALAIPPGYQRFLCFMALISSTHSCYKHISVRSSKCGTSVWGSRGGFGTWHLKTRNFERKNRMRMTPVLPSCPRVSSCTWLPTLKASWHSGHHLVLPHFFSHRMLSILRIWKALGRCAWWEDSHLGSSPLPRARADT